MKKLKSISEFKNSKVTSESSRLILGGADSKHTVTSSVETGGLCPDTKTITRTTYDNGCSETVITMETCCD
jgi:hypothetical protein